MGAQRRWPMVALWGQCPGRRGLYKLPQAMLISWPQGGGVSHLSCPLSPMPSVGMARYGVAVR